jgi:hypothetical protein
VGTRVLIGVLALLALAGGAPGEELKKAAVEEPKKQAPVTIPIEVLKSKHIAVKAMINGKGPYRLIFDTGAPIILINTKTARDSGVLDKDARKPLLSIFNAFGSAKVKSFELGAARIENTAAAVMDHPTIDVLSRVVGPIEGLVGFSYFARYKLTIDYEAKQMTLTPSGYAVNEAELDPDAMGRRLIEGHDERRMLVPAAQWGFRPDKDKTDDEAGVEVKEVFAASAAAAAGLKPGDRLLTLDGRWTDSVADTFLAAQFIKPGTAVKAVIRRDGKELVLTITPRAGL